MKRITKEIIEEIKEKILNQFQPQKIVLFGSYAWGSPKSGSDLDLLIVKESKEVFHKRSIPLYRLFRKWMIPMDFIVYTPEELMKYKDIKGSFINKVLAKGRILYG
ncbi:MAG: nucleotidyltransferase domain-containing protein [bacterium]